MNFRQKLLRSDRARKHRQLRKAGKMCLPANLEVDRDCYAEWITTIKKHHRPFNTERFIDIMKRQIIEVIAEEIPVKLSPLEPSKRNQKIIVGNRIVDLDIFLTVHDELSQYYRANGLHGSAIDRAIVNSIYKIFA